MDQVKVGKFIAQLRKKKKLTQNELGDKLSLTDKAVSKWECGLGCPDISLLIPLSEILETSIYELLIGESVNEVPIKKVDEALKVTIDVATKGKQTNKKYKIILIISIILILIELIVLGLFWYSKNTYKYPKPENMKINIINDFLSELNDKSCVIDLHNEMCDNGDYHINTVTVLAMKLPMIAFKDEVNFNQPYPGTTENQDYVSFNFELHTEKEINKDLKDNNYTKKSMIVNSIILFNYVENLDSIRYIFKDKTYLINKLDVEKIYKEKYIEISALKQTNNWQKYVINKLKDKDYIDLILDNIVEK